MAKRKWYERTVVEGQGIQPYTRMDILHEGSLLSAYNSLKVFEVDFTDDPAVMDALDNARSGLDYLQRLVKERWAGQVKEEV